MTDGSDANDDGPSEKDGPRMHRRTLLAAGLAGLAACSSPSAPSTPTTSRRRTPTMPRNTDRPTEEPPTEDPGNIQFRNAAPGEVQEVIDAAAEGPSSRVLLHPDHTYDPAKPWAVRAGVTLDYNGAHVTLSRDHDLHRIHPGGCVEQPVVDLRSVTGSYSSSVFLFDSARNGFYGENRPWHVRGGITRGRPGEGTLYEFRQGGGNAIYFVHADHAVWGIGTVVEMHRRDKYGVNGNRIYGLWHGFRRGIHMHNRGVGAEPDNISGNHFDVIAQPTNASEILWDLEAGHFNVLRGRLWDFQQYDDVMWRIHGDDEESRLGNLLHWFPVGGSAERFDNSNIGGSVFDDRLGDPRNRVVVPWLQGMAVGHLAD